MAAAPHLSQDTLRPTPWRDLLTMMRTPFVGAMFLSLLLIGADRLGIHPAGLNLRITFPALMAAFGFLYMDRQRAIPVPRALSILFFLLAIAGAVSTINSLAVTKSLGYTVWVFFNFFVIIALCYNLALSYPAEKVLSLWFMIFRIHVVLAFLDTIRHLLQGDMERSFLWFYEPSYMAIFLTAYFGSSLYMFLRVGRAYALDFGLATIVLLVTASATGIFGIVFALLLNFIVARQRLKLFLWTAVLGATFIGILYVFFSDTLYFKLIAGFLLDGDSLSKVILSRAGNRWIRLQVGWEAFLHHPWTGVGIGGDTAYMDASPLPEESYEYVTPWLDLSGQPFCNIFVEVLGTMGLVGFAPFISIMGYSIWQLGRALRATSPLAPIAIAFLIGFFCSILAMQLEGTMLRYYLWSPLGLAMGTLGQMRRPPSGTPTAI
jgi:O-antigen ligase